MAAFAYETYWLGIRTTRRFLRVPSNFISIVFFPLMQLLVFSQLYKDIVQLPAFGEQTSYWAYLAPGQAAFTWPRRSPARGSTSPVTPASVLGNGDLGWVQIANFLVTGLLVIGAAVGMRRALLGTRCSSASRAPVS